MLTVKYEGEKYHVDFKHAISNSTKKVRNPATGRMVTETIPQLYHVETRDDGTVKTLPTKGVTACYIYTESMNPDGSKNTQIVARGTAECNPTDNWDYNEGRKHALADAFVEDHNGWRKLPKEARKLIWDTYFATRHGKW